MKLFQAFFFLAWMLFASCSKDKATYAPPLHGCPDSLNSVTFSYSRDIQPIIAKNCSGPTCHNGGNDNYDFTTYGVVANRISNGKMDYRLLLPVSDPQHMPDTGPPLYQGTNLDPCDLYKILAWIKQGYQNN